MEISLGVGDCRFLCYIPGQEYLDINKTTSPGTRLIAFLILVSSVHREMKNSPVRALLNSISRNGRKARHESQLAQYLGFEECEVSLNGKMRVIAVRCSKAGAVSWTSGTVFPCHTLSRSIIGFELGFSKSYQLLNSSRLWTMRLRDKRTRSILTFSISPLRSLTFEKHRRAHSKEQFRWFAHLPETDLSYAS